MSRDLPHIVVPSGVEPRKYRPHPRRIARREPPSPENPRAHARSLRASLEAAVADLKARRHRQTIRVEGAIPGLYITFEGQDGFPLKVESLARERSGIEVVAVKFADDAEKAVVFVPDGKVKLFFKRIEDYANERTAKGERKHKELVESIARIRHSTLRALWTDEASEWPTVDQWIWWEVWLRDQGGDEERRFRAFAKKASIAVGRRRLTFPDRVVVLARATARALSASIDVLGDVAELRRAKEVQDEFLELDRESVHEVLEDLVRRMTPAPVDAPAVCVLDTGVNNAHPLLAASLAKQDLHAWDPAWTTDDHEGHGTEMAGLALLGNLTAPLLSRAQVVLRHRLESVKILPPRGANAPELYGAITAGSVALVEIEAPERRRGFALAVTTKDQRDRGEPTSWSASIDALAAGRSFDETTQGLVYLDDDAPQRRLFVVCTGNVDHLMVDHLTGSDAQPIHDPAQAWNALTVGACTDLVTLDPHDPQLKGLQPVAPAGDLSPYSTTSVAFAAQWPLKPDVVFEGGNAVHNGVDAYQIDSLSLLTTYYRPLEKLFVPTWATSAATAQVARFVGVLAAEYPSLWPETIRALIVQSSRWTRQMESRVRGGGRRVVERQLLRRYGFGVPDLGRALHSARNALTLVVQDELRPFDDGRLAEMKVHALPWPIDELRVLGEVVVRMRVTLSYFIEPNPARRGWRKRHSYASHGLRFDVRGATESSDDFVRRVNAMSLAEDEARPSAVGDHSEWRLGPVLRHRGSLHSDIWEGTAADLAERGEIAVFPVSGWWKEQPLRDRSARGVPYALVVSIETDDTEVDLYTPVAVEVGVPIATTS